MPDQASYGHIPNRATQVFGMESSLTGLYETDLSLLLFLRNCSVKGLAGGGTLMQGKARGIRYGQGRIGGLNGQRLPHLHWLSLQSIQHCASLHCVFGLVAAILPRQISCLQHSTLLIASGIGMSI